MLVRDLIETATFKTDPVCVLFNSQIKSLPMLSSTNIKLFNQIGALTSIESCNNVESLVVESNSCMEVSTSV